MLAYVFWHRCEAKISRKSYEEKLCRFHVMLNASEVPGFNGSLVVRISGAPWFNSPDSEGYEDWYLLEGSEVIDRINEQAAKGARKEPHDDVARFATDFHGGLYRLRNGIVLSPQSVSQRYAIWISKPRGTTYDSFYKELDQYMPGRGASLWRRQMVLGPTSEFCLITDQDVSLPPEFAPASIPREIVWQNINPA